MLLRYTANGALKALGELFYRCSCLDTALFAALFAVILPAADGTFIFHIFTTFLPDYNTSEGAE